MHATVRCPLQCCCHGIPGALAACCYLGFVDSQTVKPENLTVIDYVSDLLVDIYTVKYDAYLKFTTVLNIEVKVHADNVRFPSDQIELAGLLLLAVNGDAF